MARPKKIVQDRSLTKIELSNYKAITPNITKNNDVIYFNRVENDRDNSLFEYMADLASNHSSTHSNLLNLKRNMTYGNGFFTEDVKTKLWLETINPMEDGNDILSAIVDSYVNNEAAALQVVWSIDGKRPVNIYSVPLHKLRANVVNEFGHVEGYWMKDNWVANNRVYGQTILKNLTQDTQTPIFVPVFNPAKAKELYTSKDKETKNRPELIGTTKQPVQIMYIKRVTSSQPYYVIPSWLSAQDYVLLEKMLGVFHNASVSNGFFPSLVINPIGSPTPEEKEKYLAAMKNSFSGAENASKAFIEFIEKAGDETKVTPIQVNNNSELFDTLSKLAMEKISNAHGTTPELAGAVTQGATLGGDANKISIHIQLFYNNVIKGFQSTILKHFNKITKAAGLQPVEIVNEHPLFLIDTTIVKENLSQDEIRKMFFGLEPLVSEATSAQENKDNTQQQ